MYRHENGRQNHRRNAAATATVPFGPSPDDDWTYCSVDATPSVGTMNDQSEPLGAPVLRDVPADPDGTMARRGFLGLFGTAFGGAKGRTDVPKIVDWYMNGKIELDSMITHVLKLDDIHQGFDLKHQVESLRSVVIYCAARVRRR